MFGFPFDAGIPAKLSIVEFKRRLSPGYLPFEPHQHTFCLQVAVTAGSAQVQVAHANG